MVLILILPTTNATNPTNSHNFSYLNNSIQSTASGGTIKLDQDYQYDNETDSSFSRGIVLQKNMILDGQGHTINGNGSFNTFKSSGNVNITLENLIIKNTAGNVVTLGNGSNIHIINCSFTDNDGILIENSSCLYILNSTFDVMNGTSLIIRNSSNINIQNLTVKNSKYAIIFDNCTDVNVSKSNIMNNKQSGINIIHCKNVNLTDNVLNNNMGSGISLDNTIETNISNNQINGNYNGVYFGVNVNNTTITGNTINNNGDGISLAKSGYNATISKNTIFGNVDGLDLDNNSDNLLITQNYISGSSHSGVLVGADYIELPTARIEYNIIYGNLGYGEIQNKFETASTSFEYNWFGANDLANIFMCPCAMSGIIQLKIIQTSSGEFQAVFYAGNKIASLLPDISVFFRLNNGLGTTETSKNGVATFPYSSSKYTIGSNELTAIADKQAVTIPITQDQLNGLKKQEYDVFITNFTSTISNIYPLTIQFQDISVGSGTLFYYWDFGDGTNSTEENPLHIYNKAGIYPVMLTVTINGYNRTVIKEIYINHISATPNGGEYNNPQYVTLNSYDTNATIYYTTDGSDPQISITRSLYNGVIPIKVTTLLRYSAIDLLSNLSQDYSQNYILNILTPSSGGSGTGGSGNGGSGTGSSGNGGNGGSGTGVNGNGGAANTNSGTTGSSSVGSSKSSMSQKTGLTAVSAVSNNSPEISVGLYAESLPSHKTVSEVSVNNPVKNVPTVGIIGIILLLLLIIGGYFEKDLVAIIRNRK